MATTYCKNFLQLCLLCASDGNVDANIDIFSDAGSDLQLMNKIHKYLTIKVSKNDGLPHLVCLQCINKLSAWHTFVENTEIVFAKLLSIRHKCVSFSSTQNHFISCKTEEVSNLSSPVDNGSLEKTSCTDAASQPCELSSSPNTSAQLSFITGTTTRSTRSASLKNKTISRKRAQTQMNTDIPGTSNTDHLSNKATRDFKLQVDPSLDPSSSVVRGTQLAFFYADKEDTRITPYINLVVINLEKKTDKQTLQEKLSRICKHVKKRYKFMNDHFRATGNSNLTPSFSCQNCNCSFFMKEEMDAHFESLHPKKVIQCPQCEERIYGPKHVLDKHIKLQHKELPKGINDMVVDMRSTELDPNLETFNPEFNVMFIGKFTKFLSNSIESKQLMLNGKMIINHDMKSKIRDVYADFISNFKPLDIWSTSKCSICLKRLKNSKIEQHKSEVHLSKREACPHCGMQIKSVNMKRHIEGYHFGGASLMCQFCDKEYSTTGKVQPHMWPMPDVHFKCPVSTCLKTLRSKPLLMRHMKVKHSGPLTCDICSKTYTNRNNMKAHMNVTHMMGDNYTPSICYLCGKKYANDRSMKEHIKFIHGEKIPCEICGEQFTKKKLFVHKKLKHSSVPPATPENKYPCRYCGKLLKKQAYVEAHEATVHQGISLSCTICVPKQYFTSIEYKNKHMELHKKGEKIEIPEFCKQVQCPKCDKWIRNRRGLRAHMKKVHDENRIRRPEPDPSTLYHCRYCPKKFARKYYYDDHEAEHRGEAMHKCPYCPQTFFYRNRKVVHALKCQFKTPETKVMN